MQATKADAKAEKLLEKLVSGERKEDFKRTLRQILQSKDKRFIAPLVDLLGFARTREIHLELLRALQQLTGEKLRRRQDPWKRLVVWLGERTDLHSPPAYLGWKGDLFGHLIDPRFRWFLYKGAPSRVRVEEVVWGGVKVDAIPALVDPPTLSVAEADYLEETEPVFGVSVNGDHRAYPLRILDWHEMANDAVGDKPVVLTYCTLCGAGILYEAVIVSRRYKFGSSGLLFRPNKLMYDRLTHTLWNQLTGKPVIGNLAQTEIELSMLPMVLTSWGEWSEAHPDTTVLDRNTG